jgi:RNA polymerase sigma factor (sigma-70 family)
MSDRELLERFLTVQDPDAFRVLVERHGPMVLSVCRNVLRQGHDVEDAFQSTFLALAKHAGTIKNRDTLGPWLHRVALRVAQKARFQAYRRRVRERVHTDTRQEHSLALDPPDLSFIPMLREEVSRLPDHYRLPVVLCYLQGKTNQDAAAQLNCPVGTIKGRLSRARQTLRDRLSRRGLDYDPDSLGPPSGG